MIRASRRTFLGSLGLAALCAPVASAAASENVVRFGVTVADNVAYAPAFAALELGFFAAAGVRLVVVPLRGVAAGEEALAAGHVDIIDHTIAYTSRMIANGLNVRVVATASTGFLGWSLIVREDNPAKGLRDLVGRKIGVGLRFSVGDMAAQRLADISSGRFELIHLSPGLLVPALRGGEVDGVLFSASLAKREVVAGNARVVHELTDPGDRTAVYGYAALTEVIERRPEDLRRFLAAVWQATAHMQNNRDWSVRFLKEFVKASDDRLAPILHDQVIANLSLTGETDAEAVERATALAARAWNAPALVDTSATDVFTNALLRDGA